MDEIIVTGGYAILRNVQEVKRVRTEDLLSSVAATAGVRTPLLPGGALLFACKGMRKALVTCRLPDKGAFKVKDVDGLETLEIAYPWLVFVHLFEGMAYESMRVYGATERPNSEDAELLKLPFRNLYADCKVCMGRDLKFSLQGSFASKAAAAERHFFDSAFNSDLDGNAKINCRKAGTRMTVGIPCKSGRRSRRMKASPRWRSLGARPDSSTRSSTKSWGGPSYEGRHRQGRALPYYNRGMAVEIRRQKPIRNRVDERKLRGALLRKDGHSPEERRSRVPGSNGQSLQGVQGRHQPNPGGDSRWRRQRKSPERRPSRQS